jgi:tetratricopeptide (TPR) repeat protein
MKSNIKFDDQFNRFKSLYDLKDLEKRIAEIEASENLGQVFTQEENKANCDVYYITACFYRCNKDYKKAINAYLSTVNLLGKIGGLYNKTCVSVMSHAVANIHKELGEYEKAAEFYYKSYIIKEELYKEDKLDSIGKEEFFKLLNNMAHFCFKLNDKQNAAEFFMKEEEILNNINPNSKEHYYSIENAGHCCYLVKANDEALSYFLKALDVVEKHPGYKCSEKEVSNYKVICDRISLLKEKKDTPSITVSNGCVNMNCNGLQSEGNLNISLIQGFDGSMKCSINNDGHEVSTIIDKDGKVLPFPKQKERGR